MQTELQLNLIRQRRQTGPVEAPADAKPRLKLLRGIRAVVFDIYGTLFSSGVGDISLATEQNRDAALRATLSDNGIQLSDTSDGIRLDSRFLDTVKAHQALRRQDGIEFPEVDIRRVWQEFLDDLKRTGFAQFDADPAITTLAIDYESRINPTQAMPELEATLDWLHEQGFVLSIISNAQCFTPLLFDCFLDRSLKDLGFCEHCNVWSYALLEGKPSQRLYRVSAERLQTHHGIEPQEVLYIGNDIRNDIWPAQACGYHTALFAGDRLSLRRRKDDPHCAEVTPDLEITALRQVRECLKTSSG